MNRLSFLKKISIGIAATVITPKVLAELPSPFICPIGKNKEWGKYWAEQVYARHLEDVKLGVDKLKLWDTVIDHKGDTYAVTGRGFGIIELTATHSDTNPSVMDVQTEHFFEYFITEQTART
jgi:hypothetical protein